MRSISIYSTLPLRSKYRKSQPATNQTMQSPQLSASRHSFQFHHNKIMRRRSHTLSVLQTCRQIHTEAHLLALSLSNFDVAGPNSHPDYFTNLTSHLCLSKVNAIRHVTLTARVSQLRALNEAWHGLPFGCPNLFLDTLTIVPTKPDVHHSAYAEVADLSQSHTLAYIFAETFKRLRNVRVVEVRNRGWFNEVVWRLVYRALVYRMWRWGGDHCGVRFLCCGDEVGVGDGQEQWFRIWPGDAEGEGWEVGEEVRRLVGANGQMPDPNLVGF